MLYNCYTFSCEFETEAILPPFKGSTFRGAFGSALKKVACALKQQNCQGCLLYHRCTYALFFEQKENEAGQEKTSPSVPHPFVIEPPLTQKTCFAKGEQFEFNLLLFGQAIESLPYCLYAFEQMGQHGLGKGLSKGLGQGPDGPRGKFILHHVASQGHVIYSMEEKRIKGNTSAVELQIEKPKEQVKEITLHLLTPLRVKYENRLKADLPFHILIRAALRRVSSLFASYGEGEPALDYRGLVQRAQNSPIAIDASHLSWFDWQRYSNRQEVKMFMGGMVGQISYQGELGEYLPILRLGEQIHLGKQTAFGLGQIRVEAR